MRRLKKVTGVVLLAAVMSMSSGLVLAGPSESPGHKATTCYQLTTYGTAESPGFFDIILITAALIM